MEIRRVELHGLTNGTVGDITIQPSGEPDEEIDLVITYSAEIIQYANPGVIVDVAYRHGEIKFLSVLEYRFFAAEYYYEDVPEIDRALGLFLSSEVARGPGFGLVEIASSPYVKNMIAKAQRYWGKPESQERRYEIVGGARHFRFCVDEYGTLDVVSLGLEAGEVDA